MEHRRPDLKGRGAGIHPPNRFDRVHAEDDFEQLEFDLEFQQSLKQLSTVYFDDDSRSVVSENSSPDLAFRYSLNPYRGCLHGCSYCYARPYHEYLGLNAGLDFESKIGIKRKAADQFREFLNRADWQGEPVTFSGITDCYQPIEREHRLTRQCLEVALEARQPIGIITKNALITRDLDLLAPMADRRLIHANISLTTLDPELARLMEPRTSSPLARLKAITALSQSGVPVNVMVAPVIPGLNDTEVPAILKAAADAGAQSAETGLLRLPLTVLPVFQDWLERVVPSKKERIEGLIRACRQGNLNHSQFGERMRGSGPIADQIRQTFQVFRKKYGLDQPLLPYNCSDFRPPRLKYGQLRLF